MVQDRQGEIFAHIHRAIDELVPSDKAVPNDFATISWWDKSTGIKTTINLSELFTKCNLPANEMKICFRLMSRYVVRGNRVGILAVTLYMLGSLGVEGHMRKDLLEAVGGSSKKIMETIQTQRTRKITAGSDAQVETTEDEEQ
jgi:hypothetical protein